MFCKIRVYNNSSLKMVQFIIESLKNFNNNKQGSTFYI